jgi:hypothetical protein
VKVVEVDGLEAAEIERLLAADKLDAGMVRRLLAIAFVLFLAGCGSGSKQAADTEDRTARRRAAPAL